MLKTKILTLLLALSATTAWADPQITFAELRHDFGTVTESAGDAVCEFEFTNTGDKPLIVLRVSVSCGCTSPEYSRKPVMPGEKGKIKVAYHAKGRPGAFEKSITVYDNSSNGHKTNLLITGNVVSARTPEQAYSHQMGAGLRTKTRALNFFDVYPTRANRTRTLAIYNDGDEPIELTTRNQPRSVAVEFRPEVLQPKKEGEVLVTFLTNRASDWGLHKEYFELYVKGKESLMHENRIALTADIWEDFDGMSRAERERAPQIDVRGTSLDFGESDEERTLDVVIRNTGKSRLTIRKIQNDLPQAFVTRLGTTTLKPNQSTTLAVRFVPRESPAATYNHHITIISNDPDNSRVIVTMTASR